MASKIWKSMLMTCAFTRERVFQCPCHQAALVSFFIEGILGGWLPYATSSTWLGDFLCWMVGCRRAWYLAVATYCPGSVRCVFRVGSGFAFGSVRVRVGWLPCAGLLAWV